jgi:hypothetical protein
VCDGQNINRVCNPAVTTPTELVTAQQRKAAGKEIEPPVTSFDWPDTQLGVLKTESGYVFFGSDGGYHARQRWDGRWVGNNKYGSVTRTTGTMDDPLGSSPPVDVTIDRNPDATVNPHYHSYIYMGGGPVYQVPAGQVGAGNLLLLCHAEINTQATLTYSLLNLAVSSDLGAHWTDIGEIIRFNKAFRASDSPPLEMGDPNLTLSPDGKYFYVYFSDWLRDGSVTNISLARAAVSDVLEGAFGGSVQRAAPFSKYYQGSWDEPGIGGRSTDLAPTAQDGAAPQVAYDRDLGRYVAISDVQQFMTYAESPDGIQWTDTAVLKIPMPYWSAYAVPVGMGDDPSVLGKKFYIYFTGFNPPAVSWDNATVKRFVVSCE